MMRRSLLWLRSQISHVLRWKHLAVPVFLVSELVVFGYWLNFRTRCTGTANDTKLMVTCNGGDFFFFLDFILIAPAMAVIWHYASNSGRSTLLRAGLSLYFFVLRFAGLWLMAHWQVVTWADLVWLIDVRLSGLALASVWPLVGETATV